MRARASPLRLTQIEARCVDYVTSGVTSCMYFRSLGRLSPLAQGIVREPAHRDRRDEDALAGGVSRSL
jgi:hypothetical protein